MDVEDVRKLFAYDRWANLRLFSVLEKIGAADFSAPVTSSFPSLRDTTFHIIFAEWLWLKRWKGFSPRAKWPVTSFAASAWSNLPAQELPSDADVASVAGLKALWESLDAERNRWFGGIGNAELRSVFSFNDMQGTAYSLPLADVVQHVVNHSTYHRGQAVTLLRQLGFQPVSLDMVFFFCPEFS